MPTISIQRRHKLEHKKAKAAAQKIANNRRTNLVPVLRQAVYEITQAAARPQQWPHRVAPRHRLDQTLKIGHKRGSCIAFFLRPPPFLRIRPSGAATLW